MVLNMEWYRVFYFTAKTGSLTKAAEELFITQPAVTHSIKQLESKIGGQLFFRTSKGVKLTSEGEVLYKYIEQAYNFIQTGERKIAEMQQLMDGEIKIGAGDTLIKHYLLPYLKEFNESYPDIHIQVTNRTTPETIELLRKGNIDLGIVNLPIEDKNLNIIETLHIEDCFITGNKYKHLAEKPISLETLINYPVILLEKGSNTRKYIDSFTKENGIMIYPEIELGSLDLLVDFSKSGLGIACVIRNFICNELANSRVFEIKLEKPIPPRKVGIVSLKNVPLSTTAKRFIDLISYN
ncbi:LysR family transcriptional regulator [Chengkuizengella axinellae]|uniref:LysR family transcriptional regulator n=1 Tax=Chengkuizengella axinellae TaxID=3064388 RepID=A0ABT9J615_9BACL|nr:LysR family transcriptional regulator [Chengkuizengella sp. 2205SS18-9]MDP5277040.1 LysR family transcriptional regulator [Chengkuizengella sp. 2205SS18-9]